MLISPVQLKELYFVRSDISVDFKHIPPDAPNHARIPFSFENILIGMRFGFNPIDDDEFKDHAFMGQMEVVIDNKSGQKKKSRKFSPYNVDVQAKAIIVVADAAKKNAPIKNLMAVNGASIMWSAIREHIAYITARMVGGAIILPTMNFMDIIEPDSKPATTRKKVRAALEPAVDVKVPKASNEP